MKPSRGIKLAAHLAGIALALSTPTTASSYGTLNNFDTVNPEDEPCHGFEIELEDCHSSDITRTYNWNHYGVPRIYDDDTVPEHVVCYVRWESDKNPDGSWSAYTAVPTGPIDPTNGHQFTNPNVNFGGEHFGVSYRGNPTTVRYFWLIDNGAGELVRGTQVQVSNPTFAYAAGQVRARVEPVEPPEVHPAEFGEATWVKSIKTTTHNNNKIKLRELVSDDPDDDDDVNWQNDEPAEIEIEWQLLQEEFGEDDGGGNGGLDGEAEDLDDGDEVVTRRWEFYKYIGPYDVENHEALGDKVADDDLHGVGVTTAAGIEYDLGDTIIVGEYLGAQMSAFDVDAELYLIDHLQDCEVGQAAPDRRVVVPGLAAFTAAGTGTLPAGMSFDPVTGILSGTPTASGDFSYKVEASDPSTPSVKKEYNFRVAAAGVALPPHSVVDTSVFPAGSGTATGDGSFDNGLSATVTATPDPGYHFVKWTENGEFVSANPNHTFTVSINTSLTANFTLTPPPMTMTEGSGNEFVLAWPINPPGWILLESPDLSANSWQNSILPVTDNGGQHHVTVTPIPGTEKFFRLDLP